jgi:BASS family bile acid:Na+ symporter
LHDYLKSASPKGWRRVRIIAGTCITWLILLPAGVWHWLELHLPSFFLDVAEALSFFAGAVLAGVGYHLLAGQFSRLNRLMPYISMGGIIYLPQLPPPRAAITCCR